VARRRRVGCGRDGDDQGSRRRSSDPPLAALVVTPSVVLESSSTQTDLLAAFWLAIAAYLAISELVFPTSRLQTAVWFGAALGLAVGTEGTALPFGIPWLLLFLAPTLRPFRPDAALSRGAAVDAVVLTLNVGSFVRNLEVFAWFSSRHRPP